MKYAAEVEDGVVVRVVVYKDHENIRDGLVLIGAKNVVGIGYSYDGSNFHPPVSSEE